MSRDTLPGRVADWAERTPDRVALREKRMGVWAELTWADYAHAVAATARALADRGVGPGDSVAILSDNRTEWLFADLGAQALGARSVGIYQTNPAEDVAYILAHSGASVLVAEDQEQVDKALAVTADTPALRHIVVLEPRGTRGYGDARLVSWAELFAAGEAALTPGWFAAQLAERDPNDASMVIYTSGTTGPPKGALISAANVLPSAARTVPLLGITADDTLLSYLPLCHVAEKIFSLFMPLAAGAVVHFGESIETVRADLVEVSPTVFLGVPRIWEKMHANVLLKMKDASWLKRWLFRRFTRPGAGAVARFLGGWLVHRPLRERLGLGHCRLPITGAAPLSADLIRWFHTIGVPILEGYGMTESAGVSHINRPGANQVGSVGQALPEVDCRLADDGEILVRGDNVFVGYLNNPEATASTIVDGWLNTGDIGAIDDQGFLRITGRKKEIIITAGGKNLSPEKIENALKTSPYIKEAVAIGDQRKFISALVQMDDDAVGDWATRRQLTYAAYHELAALPEVVKLIDGEVKRANALLARVEQVRAFRIFPKALHQDDGELTATQKVRRRAVVEAYPALIEGMYR